MSLVIGITRIYRWICVYDIEADRRVEVDSGHFADITSICMAMDGSLVTASNDNSVKIWDIKNIGDGTSELTILERSKLTFDLTKVVKVHAHPTQRTIAILLENNTVLLKSLTDLALDDMKIQVQDSEVTCIGLEQNRLIYGTNKGKAYVWDRTKLDDPVYEIDTDSKKSVINCPLRRSYLLLLCDCLKSIQVWNISQAKIMCKQEIPEYTVIAATLSYTGKYVVCACSGGFIIVFDSATGNLRGIKELNGEILSLLVREEDVIVLLDSGSLLSLTVVGLKNSTKSPSSSAGSKRSSSDVTGSSRSSSTSSAACVII